MTQEPKMDAKTVALGLIALGGLYVFVWSLCARAAPRDARERKADDDAQMAALDAWRIRTYHIDNSATVPTYLEDEARDLYELSESMGRDLPPAA